MGRVSSRGGDVEVLLDDVCIDGFAVDDSGIYFTCSDYNHPETLGLFHLDPDFRAVRRLHDGGPNMRAVVTDSVRIYWIDLEFLNLLTNALQALEGHDGPRRVGLGARVRGDAVELTVEDTGPGIAPEACDRIFDTFFTTKEAGSGPGLGLSLCYGIVRDHGGDIRAEAAAGGGARFVVEVPVAEGVPAAAPTKQAPRERIRKGCVLVVDDEPVLRESIARTLRDLGYECEWVGDAATAAKPGKRGEETTTPGDTMGWRWHPTRNRSPTPNRPRARPSCARCWTRYPSRRS